VLYLLIVVGCTSAEGRLKSQYREKVLGGGRDIQRKYMAEIPSATSLPSIMTASQTRKKCK
jgi:hypothetical protein